MKRKNKKPSPDILPLESADSEGPAGRLPAGCRPSSLLTQFHLPQGLRGCSGRERKQQAGIV